MEVGTRSDQSPKSNGNPGQLLTLDIPEQIIEKGSFLPRALPLVGSLLQTRQERLESLLTFALLGLKPSQRGVGPNAGGIEANRLLGGSDPLFMATGPTANLGQTIPGLCVLPVQQQSLPEQALGRVMGSLSQGLKTLLNTPGQFLGQRAWSFLLCFCREGEATRPLAGAV